MTILISFIIGLIVGFGLSLMAISISRRLKSYSGVLKIIREDDKLIYSLELQEDPSMLEQASEVTFKVETSDESSESQTKLFV